MNYKKSLKENIKKLKKLQNKFYAQDKHSLLIIFQALDAAGKDSTIKHVMSGINPQGCVVHSFKQLTKEEYQHHFLWKGTKCLPERGMIGIFNRSYYEEVLITQVHPEFILNQKLPSCELLEDIDDNFWQNRYDQINDFEKNLNQNGTIILKFFLDVSKDEQKRRFLERINNQNKNWKFEMGDLKEREHWDTYQKVFGDVISKTNTDYGKWFVIPANDKPLMRWMVSEIIIETLENMNLQYPTLTDEKIFMLQEAKERLENDN